MKKPDKKLTMVCGGKGFYTVVKLMVLSAIVVQVDDSDRGNGNGRGNAVRHVVRVVGIMGGTDISGSVLGVVHSRW